MLTLSTLIETLVRHRRVLAVMLLALAPEKFSVGVAQERNQAVADPQGWKLSTDSPTEPGLNRPAAISQESDELLAALRSNQPAQVEPATPMQPDQDVRRQIGLASFDENPPVSAPQQDDPQTPAQSRLPAPSGSNSESSKAGSETTPTGPTPSTISAQPFSRDSKSNSAQPDSPFADFFAKPTETLASPSGIQGSLKFAFLIGALSLAPALILMTTSYVRVVVVLSLLKQAFGGQQLPPAQVLTALSLFISLLVMTPVWNEVKQNAIDPYSANEIDWNEAWSRGLVPIKAFMVRQIQLAGNEDSVAVFYKYADVGASLPPTELSDVPVNVLIPAFMISELKVAFLLGFQIFLPFLVLDLIVSSVTVSMGMLMLPPQMVSFPLKLVLFVLVDGWNLVIGMLLQSFGARL